MASWTIPGQSCSLTPEREEQMNPYRHRAAALFWVNRYRPPFESLAPQPTRTGNTLADALALFD